MKQSMPTVQSHALFTSAGHDFIGRHGQESGDHEITTHDSIELVASRGIPGDRFYDWKESSKGQLTFINQAVIDDIRRHAGNPELPASAFRRNAVISGMDLNSLIGTTFSLAGIRLKGTEECRPCYWMDESCG